VEVGVVHAVNKVGVEEVEVEVIANYVAVMFELKLLIEYGSILLVVFVFCIVGVAGIFVSCCFDVNVFFLL